MVDAVATARSARGIVGGFYSGSALIRVKDVYAAWGDIIGPLDISTLELSPGTGKKVLRKINLLGQEGQVLDSVTGEAGTPTIKVTFTDSGRELFAMGLRGTVATVSESGSTRSDKVVAVINKGSWMSLGDRNIQVAGFSGKHANNNSLSADTDYILDATMLKYGFIYIPTGSGLSAAENAKWSYTYLSTTGYKIASNKLPELRLWLYLAGKNRATSSPATVEVYEAVVDSEKGFAANGEFVMNSFSGEATTPSGKSEPFCVEDLTFATS